MTPIDASGDPSSRGPPGATPSTTAPDRVTQLLKLLEADPKDVFCLYGLGLEYAKRGATDEALAWFDRCLATDPTYCYAYFHKARALEEADRMDEAVATLRLGLIQAKASGDAHAASEIAGYLDQLT